MGAFSNMDYELQSSEAAVSDAFTEDDAMDMPQTAPVEPATASSPTAAPTPAAASEPATAPNTQSEDEARRAHEASEAKRKAEWDARQAEKQRAEQAALEKLDAMSPAELLKAAAKRVSADTEKLTRRNMKESVAEFIQTKCIDDLDFARLTMHPRKSMIHCFQYISRKAWDYVQDELKANGVQPGPGQQAYGCDIPDDLCYAKSCGRTGHHYKDGLAFKFEDDAYETVLRSIEWTPSRTGEIAPVAIFDTVEIDGCAVSRASLHNLSFIENLELVPGCRIKVSKRNQIIPHVEENLDRDCYAREKVVPARCPCCGQPTRIHTTRNTVNGVEKVTAALFCDNEHCETRKLRKFVHFASPKALNIMGLSESILEKFIGKGWLHSYMDIFALDKHRAEIVQMEGFGEKSWQNLWDAIQHSRITTFEQYLTAMDIPMVGSTASKAICQRFRGNLAEFETAVCQSFDFTQLPDFGETLHRNIHQWFRSEENWTIWTELRRLVCIKTYQPPAASTDMSNPFVGKTLVVTGKVEPYTRDGINAKIESLGAHAGSSVSSKTDYLICGENAGSKLAKAQELGIKILSPDEFFRMAGESAYRCSGREHNLPLRRNRKYDLGYRRQRQYDRLHL